MNKIKPKYTLTAPAFNLDGHILHRVKYADGTLGGFIESEKNLQDDARVLDISMVYGNAVVKDNAIIQNGSSVYDNAIISEHAIVSGASIVKDNATVSDFARVSLGMLDDHTSVYGTAMVENSVIKGNVQITGKVKNSRITGKMVIKGLVIDSELSKDCIVEYFETIKNLKEKFLSSDSFQQGKLELVNAYNEDL